MKPFYVFKGKYKDGRKRVVIIYADKEKNIALPKPEVLLETLKNPKNIKEDRGNSGNLKAMH